MAGEIIDGKAIAKEIKGEVKKEALEFASKTGRPPCLTVILVGENPASEIYVRNKVKSCKKADIKSENIELAASVGEEDLLAEIDRLNGADEVDGILVQLPLPDDIDESKVISRIDPRKDVDGFHPENVGKLVIGSHQLAPCTPSGIIEALLRHRIEIEGARAVIVGRSNIVGKPLALMLLHRHATVTLCHSRTRDLPGVCSEADILVAAMGRPAFIGPEFVKEGAAVIDVGINRIEDRTEAERLFGDDPDMMEEMDRKGRLLVGDVHFSKVSKKAGAITPVPGGVGPLTIAMLLKNTLKAAFSRAGIRQ